MITIREAWRQGQAQLKDSPSASLDARLLLEHVIQKEHAYLLAHGEQQLSPAQLQRYQTFIREAAAHHPIPYLTGKAPFYGLEFRVTPAVLIPRPETEQLVEFAIHWGRARGRVRAVDVGTGSGCIAVSLAVHLPASEIVAVDLSAPALAVARENANRLAAGRVAFAQTDLLQSFCPGFDLILANLPYIAGHEWLALDDGVKFFEPALALHGGSDGLDLVRRLLPQAAERLYPGGMALLEIGWQQGESVRELARGSFPGAEIEIMQDFAGLDRMVVIRT